MVDTAEKIKTYRNINKLTQTELGKLVGVGKTTICNWETGYSFPDPESLLKLSIIFSCSVDHLLNKNSYEEKLIDELKDYSKVARMAKDANITPAQLEEQVKTLKKILGK
jgi:transcriptional regulator with XRE-family HTH domain